MTRREEIEKASICQYQVIGTIEEQKAFKNGFVKGAYWADTTMLNKVCDWLKENIWVYINYEGCSGEELENDVIEDFRKAMEE